MMGARRSVGGTMRSRGMLLAGLCVLCICQVACADEQSGGLKKTMTNEIVESAASALGGKPVEMLIEDTYPVVVRDGLKKLYQALKSFWLTLAYGDIEVVSDMVMEKLRVYLFGNRRVQQKTWQKLRNSFRDYLRDWWLTTPLVPVETLKTGVWHALLKLAADDLLGLLGGTPEYEKVKQLVLDEKVDVVGQWVQDIQRQMMQGELQGGDERISSRKQAHSPKRLVAQKTRKSSTSRSSHNPAGAVEPAGSSARVKAVSPPANIQ